VNLMIVHGSMDGLIFLGHVKIGLKYVVIGLFHFLFWSIYTSSMYNFIYVNVHQKGIHPMLYQFGKINWFNLFCSKWVKSVAYKWIVHVFISYCVHCNIIFLDLIWAPHGVNKHHSADFTRSNVHSSSTNAINNHLSSIRCFF
jgi:hypothetical protein